MGVTRQQKATWPLRGKMRSPGRPPAWQRDQQQRFWVEIAKGTSSEEAAVSVGVASVVGSRWFREAGGMRPISLQPLSGRYLSLSEREEIAIHKAKGVWRSRDRPTGEALAVDDLTGAPPKRCHSNVRRPIGQRPRSGTRIGERAARRSRSSPRTSRCTSTCRTDSPEDRQTRRVSKSTARPFASRDAATGLARTGDWANSEPATAYLPPAPFPR